MKAIDLVSGNRKNYFVNKGKVIGIRKDEGKYGTSLLLTIDGGTQYPNKIYYRFNDVMENANKYFPLIKSYNLCGIDLEVDKDLRFNLEQLESIQGKEIYFIRYKIGDKYRTYNIISSDEKTLVDFFEGDTYTQNRIKSAAQPSVNEGDTTDDWI